MPGVLAVIELSFDPTLRLGELAIRWQTVGVTIALLAALAVAASMVAELPAADQDRQHDRGATGRQRQLRVDDMVLIVAGIVPGAVVGGRLLHALVYWEAYAAAPLSILDPAAGSLSLLGAVVGGALSAAYVGRLLGAPLYRWADTAAIPVLLAIGLGKLAQILGGSGQGLPFDGPWATAFTGAGPWVSGNPELASHPSQLYEALWAFAGIPIVVNLTGPRRSPTRVNRRLAWADRAGREGQLFVNTLVWFLAGRIVVGFTWRDPGVLGPVNLEQLAGLLLLGRVILGPRRERLERGFRRDLGRFGRPVARGLSRLWVYRGREHATTAEEHPNDDRDRRTTD